MKRLSRTPEESPWVNSPRTSLTITMMFSHLAVEVAGEEASNEWLEPVDDEEYAKVNK